MYSPFLVLVFIVFVCSIFIFLKERKTAILKKEQMALTAGIWGILACYLNRNNKISLFWKKTIENQDVIIFHYKAMLFLFSIATVFYCLINNIDKKYCILFLIPVWYFLNLFSYVLIKIRAAHLFNIEKTKEGEKIHEVIANFTYHKYAFSSQADQREILNILQKHTKK